MRDSVPSARYSSVCNVLRQWRIWLIPTYRVYRLYDTCICLYVCAYTVQHVHGMDMINLLRILNSKKVMAAVRNYLRGHPPIVSHTTLEQ